MSLPHWSTIVGVVFALGTAQQPARDAPVTLPPGTASISGVVVTDESTPRPVRGGVVTLNNTDRSYGDTAITNEQGRFEFRTVPAGRFQLVADKAGYVRTRLGATRPGRAGTPIAVADGQQVRDLKIAVARGAVLSGRVTGPDGEPLAGLSIELLRAVSIGGERRYVEAYSSGGSETDDRGVYRLFGLAAGEYLIRAQPQWAVHSETAGMQVMTAADAAWARALLQSPGRQTTGPGAAQPRPESAVVSWAPVYYPNSVQRSGAVPMTVAAGEERLGLDIALQLVAGSRIEGTVVAPDGGRPTVPPEIYLVDTGPNAAGFYGVRMSFGSTFVIDGVPPGPYALAAVVPDSQLWAMTDINVSGKVMTAALSLQPGLTLAGRIDFDGTRPRPSDLTRVRVRLSPTGTASRLAFEPLPVTPKPDGTFVVIGLIPGEYRLTASVPGRSSPAGQPDWMLRSAISGGRDIADAPLTVRADRPSEPVVVTFSDRLSELGGRLQDTSGRPAPDYFIIVFARDEQSWFRGSRRIAQTRPASDGVYTVQSLPPGDYWLAALTDVERDEPFDPAFLRQLIPSAIRLTISDGEKKTQDLRIGG